MLLKGSQKKIVRMQSGDSRLFDEAFFVLRDDAAPPATGDMLTEANRILAENMIPHARRRAGFTAWVARAALFLGGAALASLLWGAALLALLV